MFIELIATVFSGIGIYFLLKPPKKQHKHDHFGNEIENKINKNKPNVRG
jgi:hypothetical protein